MNRNHLIALSFCAGALALPASAAATLTEVGQTSVRPTPACPSNPCLAVSRTTGYQAKAGSLHNLFTIPRSGKIVAWTISLGKPTKKQTTFFNTNEGGVSSAGITILRPSPRLFFSVVDQGPIMPLTSYFGETVQFPLDRAINVQKGWVVALTVPTWAPALSVGYGNDTSWRASRTKKQCTNTATQTAQLTTGSRAQYFCLYRTARLSYSATLISTP